MPYPNSETFDPGLVSRQEYYHQYYEYRPRTIFGSEFLDHLIMLVASLLFLVLIANFFLGDAHAQSLSRLGPDVVMNTGVNPGSKFTIQFAGKFGGAPLSWYKNGTLVSNQFPGEGVQIVYDSGQDGTQSTATGLDYYPISQIGKPETYRWSYFGYEEIYAMQNGQAVYQTTSFLPYFWVSLEWLDDSIPSDARGDHRWSTMYHDILNLGATGYQTWGVPLYFAGTPQVPSGIILLGDEIAATYNPSVPWHQMVNKIPAGRFALRMRLSMKDASADSVAGILIRKNPKLDSSSNINSVFFAPGQHLNINRQGVIQMISNGALVWQAPQQYWASHKASLETAAGMQIEIRTHNWATEKMELYFNDRYEGSVSAPVQGEVFGLVASATSGRIAFLDRQFIDVGIKCTSRWETTPRNTIKATLSVYRVAEPMVAPMYRLNLPVAFVNGAWRRTTYVWNQNWGAHNAAAMAQQFPAGWVPFKSPTWESKALWSGSSDGAYGIWIKPLPPLPSNGHLIIAPSVQALSKVPYQANYTPVPFTREQLVIETAPEIRWDLLHD